MAGNYAVKIYEYRSKSKYGGERREINESFNMITHRQQIRWVTLHRMRHERAYTSSHFIILNYRCATTRICLFVPVSHYVKLIDQYFRKNTTALPRVPLRSITEHKSNNNNWYHDEKGRGKKWRVSVFWIYQGIRGEKSPRGRRINISDSSIFVR